MKTILVSGPPKSGKTAYLIKKFCSRIKENSLVILPAAETVRYVKKTVFAAGGPAGYLGRKVLTFDQLVNLLVPPKPISAITKHCLLQQIVSGLQLEYFSAAVDYPGFYEVLSDFISELKMGLITAENFYQAANRIGPASKDKDIFKIYKDYEEKMTKLNWIDHQDKFLKAQELLAAKSSYRYVYVDGFVNFSPVELEILKALNYSAAEMIITLTLDKDISPAGNDVYSPTARTYEKLKNKFSLAEQVCLEEQRPPVPAAITAAPGPARETEGIAREIKLLLSSGGRRPDDIIVLFRNLGGYKNIVHEYFEHYGIPCSISEEQELKDNITLKTIMSMFEIKLHDWSRESMFKFLKSGCLRVDFLGRHQDIDRLEVICLQSGIQSGRDDWRNKITNPELKGFFVKLIGELDAIPQTAALRDYVSLVFELTDKFISSQLSDEGRIKLRDVLIELCRLHNVIPLSVFYQYLEMIAAKVTIPFNRAAGSRVQVMDVHRSRGLSFPLVFLGGLNEGLFPRQVQENLVYGDRERTLLRNAGIELEETKYIQEQELFLFQMAVSTCRERLYLSYSDTDNSSKEILPSHYLDSWRSSAQLKKIHIADVVPDIDSLGAQQDLNSTIAYNLWQRNEVKAALLYNKKVLQKDPLWQQTVDNIFREQTFCPGVFQDRNLQQKIADIFNPDYLFSISQFNEYGTCPFAYLCQRLLKLEPLEEPQTELDPADEGTLYHNILWELYTSLRKNNKLPLEKNSDTKAIKAQARQLAKKYFLALEQNGLINNYALWRIKQEEIINNLIKIIDYEINNPGLRPVYFEIGFGLEKTSEMDNASVAEPLVIEKNIKIAGKIDRIDINQWDMFVVIDYKTGSKEIRLAEITAGTNLQLPIYLLAAKDIILKNIQPFEAFFWHVKLGDKYHANALKRFSVTAGGTKPNPKWDYYLDTAAGFVKEYAAKMRRGEFPLRKDKDCPPFCDYKNICRKK